MKSGFRSLHPVPAFCFYAGLFALAMLLFHPVFLLTAALAMIALNVLHDRGKRLRSGLAYYLLIAAAVAVVNPLVSHRGNDILFYLADKPVTRESVVYGLTAALVLCTVFFAFASYNQVMTSGKFLYVFRKVSPKAALLTMMAVRFVPLLQWRLRQIADVQRTRGIDPLEGPLRKRMKDGMKLLQILLTWSLEEALQTADSMKSRGYGTGPRSSYETYAMDRRDWTVAMLMLTAGGVCFACAIAGFGSLTIYPRMESIRLERLEWLEYGCFCVYLLIPIVLEGRERVRWHFWK